MNVLYKLITHFKGVYKIFLCCNIVLVVKNVYDVLLFHIFLHVKYIVTIFSHSMVQTYKAVWKNKYVFVKNVTSRNVCRRKTFLMSSLIMPSSCMTHTVKTNPVGFGHNLIFSKLIMMHCFVLNDAYLQPTIFLKS